MRPTRRSSTALLFALLLFALLVGFAAFFGGGDDWSGREGEGRPQFKIAPGTVESVDPEAETLVLRPTRGEPMTFAIRPLTRIELDGEPAELADLREGQAAQVRYVVREGENRARRVVAFGDGEETTG